MLWHEHQANKAPPPTKAERSKMDTDYLAVAYRKAVDPDIDVVDLAGLAAKIAPAISPRAALALYAVWLETHPVHPMRFAALAPIEQSDRASHYTPGARGYTDYPALSA